MRRRKRSHLAVIATLALLATSIVGGTTGVQAAPTARPNRVLIVVFDQMLSKYADQFMPTFSGIRDAGTNFNNAYLGYMASETVIAHNVITSGQSPKNMGWVDEAYRDTNNLFGKGANAMHITGDLSLADFGTLVDNRGYPKLADYLHKAYPGTKFITVGEKSYAVETATASTGDIAVRLSSRKSNITADFGGVDPDGTVHGGCKNLTTNYPTLPGEKGAWRYPFGRNVPSYLLAADTTDATLCGRFFINADKGNDYGTKTSFPSYLYPEEGNRFIPGSDLSAQAGHLGGDTWAADAAIAMMANEDWSGMFVTLGAIDKTGHMFGADYDADNANPNCATGEGQVHVQCAARNADAQLDKLLTAVAAVDAAKGGETLVVLTADHGATYGANFHGKDALLAGDSNWYYAPNGVWDAGSGATTIDTSTYNSPSPDIAAFQTALNGNLQFSYQSTAVEAWLYDRSPAKMKVAAAAALALPDATASYYRSGNAFKLYGTNDMTSTERDWWKVHGQEIVDTMASANGPDVVALLHDRTSYGVYGDHGGAQESVQRVPMVFWSPSLAFANETGRPFKTTDVMPTILATMGIKLTAPVDGEARPLDH